MNTYEIMDRIQRGTQDYFYATNKRLSFGSHGWVIKIHHTVSSDNKSHVYLIDSHEAERIINLSMAELPIYENVIHALA